MRGAGGPEHVAPWQEPSLNGTAGSRPVAEERVPLTGAAAWRVEPAVARLASWRTPGDDGEDVQALIADRAASAVALGRIVARLREAGRDPIRVAVVEARDGIAWVLFSNWEWTTIYTAPDVDTAVRAVRAILASGSAYNW